MVRSWTLLQALNSPAQGQTATCITGQSMDQYSILRLCVNMHTAATGKLRYEPA
jgi:hypothetical protein